MTALRTKPNVIAAADLVDCACVEQQLFLNTSQLGSAVVTIGEKIEKSPDTSRKPLTLFHSLHWCVLLESLILVFIVIAVGDTFQRSPILIFFLLVIVSEAPS